MVEQEPAPSARVDRAVTAELAGVSVRCYSDHAGVRDYWRAVLDGFLQDDGGARVPDVTIQLHVVPRLPTLPAYPPFFRDAGHEPGDPRPNLVAYRTNGGVWLHFTDGAVVQVASEAATAPVAYLAEDLLHDLDRVEDVTMAAIAAGLRRRGLYILHAFAAARDGQAILLSGASGSGKTTTGLNLLGRGWEYLANDLALLRRTASGVLALPSPGGFNIRPQTVALLPGLRPLAESLGPAMPDGRLRVPASRVTTGWGPPADVALLLFPSVRGGRTTRVFPLSPAIALARLMAESVDAWDEPAMEGHVNVLARLSHQAPAYRLMLGRDVNALPDRLAELLATAAPTAPSRPRP